MKRKFIAVTLLVCLCLISCGAKDKTAKNTEEQTKTDTEKSTEHDSLADKVTESQTQEEAESQKETETQNESQSGTEAQGQQVAEATTGPENANPSSEEAASTQLLDKYGQPLPPNCVGWTEIPRANGLPADIVGLDADGNYIGLGAKWYNWGKIVCSDLWPLDTYQCVQAPYVYLVVDNTANITGAYLTTISLHKEKNSEAIYPCTPGISLNEHYDNLEAYKNKMVEWYQYHFAGDYSYKCPYCDYQFQLEGLWLDLLYNDCPNCNFPSSPPEPTVDNIPGLADVHF